MVSDVLMHISAYSSSKPVVIAHQRVDNLRPRTCDRANTTCAIIQTLLVATVWAIAGVLAEVAARLLSPRHIMHPLLSTPSSVPLSLFCCICRVSILISQSLRLQGPDAHVAQEQQTVRTGFAQTLYITWWPMCVLLLGRRCCGPHTASLSGTGESASLVLGPPRSTPACNHIALCLSIGYLSVGFVFDCIKYIALIIIIYPSYIIVAFFSSHSFFSFVVRPKPPPHPPAYPRV